MVDGLSTLRTYGKGNRRSLDIARDILLIVRVRMKKTRIMYQANLSFVQVKKYLHKLLEKGLLRYDGDCYLITEKGAEFLELYDEYIESCKKLELNLKQNDKDRLMLEHMCSNANPACKTERT
jgi:predicted transcriptional regulator